MVEHQVGPALRTTTIHQAFSVYKDYDGEVPDGPEYVICATKELAQEVAELLNAADPEHRDDEDCDGEVENSDNPFKVGDFGWPYADGAEHAAGWTYRLVQEERDRIATTLEQACAQVKLSGGC